MTDDRYAHYDRAYYIGRACPESQSYDKRILRPGDMGAALCYAFGIDSYAEVCRILGIPQDNPRYLPETTLDEQLDAIHAATRKMGDAVKYERCPDRVLEIGGGRFELACAFKKSGVKCTVIEPSPAAVRMFFDAYIDLVVGHSKNIVLSKLKVRNMGLGEAIESGGLYESFDTIIFCESIEHIPEAEFADAWPLLVKRLRSTNGRLIITNWIDYHPIVPDDTGWDHVRLVDDAFYDSLTKDARRTVFRQGSHLVLEF